MKGTHTTLAAIVLALAAGTTLAALSTPGQAVAVASSSPPETPTVHLYAFRMPGSTRNVDADVTEANEIWTRRCGIAVVLDNKNSQLRTETILDMEWPPGELNGYPPGGPVTTEEVALIKNLTPTLPTKAIPLYYVPTIINTLDPAEVRRAETLISGGVVQAGIVVSDNAVYGTLAHEIGHVLIGPNHPGDRDNLMAEGDLRHVGADKLEETAQCEPARLAVR